MKPTWSPCEDKEASKTQQHRLRSSRLHILVLMFKRIVVTFVCKPLVLITIVILINSKQNISTLTYLYNISQGKNIKLHGDVVGFFQNVRCLLLYRNCVEWRENQRKILWLTQNHIWLFTEIKRSMSKKLCRKPTEKSHESVDEKFSKLDIYCENIVLLWK